MIKVEIKKEYFRNRKTIKLDIEFEEGMDMSLVFKFKYLSELIKSIEESKDVLPSSMKIIYQDILLLLKDLQKSGLLHEGAKFQLRKL